MFFDDYHATIAVPQSLTCTPVKLALKFYHDQVVYLPADMSCGAKVDIPKSCPIVHRPRDSQTIETIKAQKEAEDMLDQTMFLNGLGPLQKWQIEVDAAVLDQCSNRAKPGEHDRKELQRHRERSYPSNMYTHVQNVKAFQARDKELMAPNVRYTNADFGCGGPFSAECLTGWDGIGLLTHRLHLWGDAVTHPKPCHHWCLAGWSGEDLDAYRKQTWGDDKRKDWRNVVYNQSAPEYTFLHTDNWAVIDYSNVSHLHEDQFDRNGNEFVRKHDLANGQVVHVPETVLVPVPERLDQVLRAMSRVPPAVPPLPEDVDQASIEDILGRLPEAFEEERPLTGEGSEQLVDTADDPAEEEDSAQLVHIAEGSESDTTAVDEPVEGPEEEQEPTPVETPEMAEARRQRARREMREKIARDFSEGKGEVVIDEGTSPAESERTQSRDNPT